MMKNVIIAIFGLLVIGGLVFFINQKADRDDNKSGPETTETIKATYANDNETLEAEFNNEADTVSFTEESTGKVTLKRAVSGSGTRYTNEDESIVFWEHQGELTITRDGVEVFRGVVSSQYNNHPPVQSKIDINAVCEGALAYMTFENGEAADKFVADCKAGEHPEVIERYKADMNIDAGAQI